MMSEEAPGEACEEKLTGCEDSVTVYCVECGTHQCAACDSALHQTSFATNKFKTHQRRSVLCEIRLCQPPARASVKCLGCAGEPALCPGCDRKRHRPNGVRGAHKRVPFDGVRITQQDSPSEGGPAVMSTMDENTNGSTPEVEAVNTRPDICPSQPVADVLSAAVDSVSDDTEEARHDEESNGDKNGRIDDAEHGTTPSSHKLINEFEQLQVSSASELARLLGCESSTPVKVVSVVGNTGDGKSYTLNHVFFNGRKVFATSSKPSSCTLGVWVAYDQSTSTIVVDTEGMMGVSNNSNQRMRMLLKVLAVSDVIIYKTDAGRLHSDMFMFLSESSSAFQQHFSKELRDVIERSKMSVTTNSIAPAAIVFHETRRTELLGEERPQSTDALLQTGNECLKARFAELKLNLPEFSSLHYCGTRTEQGATNFTKLRSLVQGLLADSSVRSPRPLHCMLSALKHLNSKFDGKLPDSLDKMFPDEYFTCPVTCEACKNRCQRTMNHDPDGGGHHSLTRCIFQDSLDNQVFLCRKCLDNSREVVVVPKTSSSQSSVWSGLTQYAWAGYVLECVHCGVIYRSRQHWYGNRPPTDDAVRTEIRHVWPGTKVVGTGTHNAARRMMEALTVTADVVTSASAKPARFIADWTTDKIAPEYWVPNALITNCHSCAKDLADGASRHHCRACGQGFCDDCSSHKMPVEWRGWSNPVRVCDACFDKGPEAQSSYGGTENGQAPLPSTASRRVGEAVAAAASAVAEAMEIPKDMLKDAARPTYWVSDEDIKECYVCNVAIEKKAEKHHCRSCGQGCCDACSQGRAKVPNRGWDDLVRVCDSCIGKLQ